MTETLRATCPKCGQTVLMELLEWHVLMLKKTAYQCQNENCLAVLRYEEFAASIEGPDTSGNPFKGDALLPAVVALLPEMQGMDDKARALFVAQKLKVGYMRACNLRDEANKLDRGGGVG